MKKLTWIAAGILAGALSLPAQQGRGGPPLAWNDADKDGVCDITGEPVGQTIGRGRMTALGGRGGQGFGGAWGRGGGRGRGAGAWGRGGGFRAAGRGFGRFQQQNTPQAQPPAENEQTQ